MNSLTVLSRLLSVKPEQKRRHELLETSRARPLTRRHSTTGLISVATTTEPTSRPLTRSKSVHSTRYLHHDSTIVTSEEEDLSDSATLVGASASISSDKTLVDPSISEHAIKDAPLSENISQERTEIPSDSGRTALSKSLPLRISFALYVLLRRLLLTVGINIDLPEQVFSLPPSTIPLLHKTNSIEPYDEPPSYESIHRNAPTIIQTSPTPPRKASWRRLLDRRRRVTAPVSARGDTFFDTDTEKASANRETEASAPSSRRSSINLFTRHKDKATTSKTLQQVNLLKPKTLILDLDETLIHSTNRLGGLANINSSAKTWGTGSLSVRLVEVVLDGKSVVYHVYKRPWVDHFLKKVATWYTVVIFTASMQEYADPVIDWLDQGRGLINGRLFRESCIYYRGTYYKDLSVVDSDLGKICLVDNSPASYAKNPANGIPIEGWVGDASDECLLDLLPLLDSLRFTSDVRRILGIRGFGQNSHLYVPSETAT